LTIILSLPKLKKKLKIMVQNKLEASKKRLSQSFHHLEKLIEQKLSDKQQQVKIAMAEINRLEKHLKTINNRYISLQTVAKESIMNCDEIIKVLDNMTQGKNGHH
jgi:NADH:ubiquinone oxidoreductase subunit D